MNRRKFVITSTISLVVITVAIAGLAFYSDFAARAFVQDLPNAVRYLPADSQAVVGMNVQKFIASPLYAQLMEKHGQEIGASLDKLVAMTGVDPRRDLDYVIGASRPSERKGVGVVIAVGRFDPAGIANFINSHTTPIKLDYKGATVLMIPESNTSGAQLEKGIAFLSSSEIVAGDLESIHAVLDVRGGAPGIRSNTSLSSLLTQLGPKETFWFAGDASILSKAPANAQITPAISAIQSVFGTLDLTTSVNGKVTVVAKDETSAGQLADFVRGLIALGNLTSGQNPDLAALVKGVQVTQNGNQFEVTITIPFDLLQKLEASKGHIIGQIK